MSGRETATALGAWAGLLLLPVIFGFVGYLVSKRMSRERDEPVRWPTHVGVVIGLIAAISALVGQKPAVAPKAVAAAPVAAESDENHVVEVIDGVADEPFPSEVHADALEGIRQQLTQEIVARYGGSIGSLTSELSAETLGGETRLHLTARASNGWRLDHYIGVLNGRRKIVSCVAADGVDFPACRQRAVEIFGAPLAGNAAANHG